MPERRRRRTRHHPVRRRRRRIGYALLGLVGLLAIVAVLLVRDVRATRADLNEARGHIGEARAALADGDVESAKAELATARNTIADADTRTNRLLWGFGERVPVAGRSFRAVDGIVDVAEAAASIGRDVVDRASGILGPGGDIEVQVTDGQVELEPIEVAAAALEQLDLRPLERAHGRLESGPSDLLVADVADARRETLELSRWVLDTVERGRALLTVLPDFLGADGPRRYFIAMQNSAELRGTGGLIGYWAVLTADDGQLDLSDPQTYGVLNRDPNDPEEDFTAVPTSEAFEQRYSHVNAAGFFANVNVDPDLPTTGTVLSDLYGQRTNEPVDGVIAVDPVGLGMILEAIGPIQVPEEIAAQAEGLPNPLQPEDVAKVTMVDVYDELGGQGPATGAFFETVATAAFERIFAGDWDAVAVGRRLAAATSGRHLQLFSTHEGELEAFELLGVGGAMATGTDASQDVLAISANNAGGNKMDVHVGHQITSLIDLALLEGTTVRRNANVDVELQNPLAPGDHDQYITGSIPTFDGRRHGFGDGEPGLNRTWFTVWASESTNLVEARDASGEPINVGLGTIHGHRAIDHYLETPSRSENSFEVDLTGAVELEQDGPDLIYRLTLWRQAKAIPDRVDLIVAGLDGWDIAEATVRGGGDGAGMGVHGEPGPEVSVEVDGDVVHVAGDVTTDVHLEIRFSKPWTERFVDWLQQPVF